MRQIPVTNADLPEGHAAVKRLWKKRSGERVSNMYRHVAGGRPGYGLVWCAVSIRIRNWLTASGSSGENREKRPVLMVKIRNYWRMFPCSKAWARARHTTRFFANGAQGSSAKWFVVNGRTRWTVRMRSGV